MKKNNKKTLKLVAATSLSIFSLMTVFVATYAWFSTNLNTQGSGATINIQNKGGRLKYVHFHQFTSSADGNFSFNKNPFATYTYDWATSSMVPDEEGVTDVWNMGHYTYLSKDHPFLMIFEYDQNYTSQEAGDMYIKATTTVGGDSLVTNYDDDDTQHLHPYTTGGGYLGARDQYGSPFYSLPQTQVRNDSHPESILIKKTNTLDYYALSSVVTFRNAVYNTSNYSSIVNGDYLSIPKSSLTEEESFTTIDNVRNRYYFNQEPCLFKSTGSGLIKYVAIVVEFYEDAINYIYSTYLGDSGLDQYQSLLYFTCDWSMEVA